MSDDPPGRFRATPFVLASGVAAALILAAPFIGEIRRAILLRFPGQFVRIIGGIVIVTIGAAVLTAIARIRDRRVWRYGAIAASLAVGIGYALAIRTGDPQVDAVERFHFVEYGLVTLLFYRAWRPAADVSALVLPVLAGVLVGSLEEWFQWFIPARIGDVRDVFLNCVAIACGLMFSVALDPPQDFSPTLTRESLRRVGAFAAAVLVVFAAFYQSVHLGYQIVGDRWSFRSAFTSAALDARAADRTERWRNTFVERPRRLSGEDQYATEGLWHVQHRNRAWETGDFNAAWHENLILERYFAPVLDTGSYVSRTGHRWAADHRAEAERRVVAAETANRYESHAHPSAIHLWPRNVYWTVVICLAATLAMPWCLHRLRRQRAAPVPTG
jgi:hypothetical protein